MSSVIIVILLGNATCYFLGEAPVICGYRCSLCMHGMFLLICTHGGNNYVLVKPQ